MAATIWPCWATALIQQQASNRAHTWKSTRLAAMTGRITPNIGTHCNMAASETNTSVPYVAAAHTHWPNGNHGNPQKYRWSYWAPIIILIMRTENNILSRNGSCFSLPLLLSPSSLSLSHIGWVIKTLTNISRCKSYVSHQRHVWNMMRTKFRWYLHTVKLLHVKADARIGLSPISFTFEFISPKFNTLEDEGLRDNGGFLQTLPSMTSHQSLPFLH